jgi:hypothetical protein
MVLLLIVISFFCTVGAIAMLIGQVSDANSRVDDLSIINSQMTYELEQTSSNWTTTKSLTESQQATISELSSRVTSLETDLMNLQLENDANRNGYNHVCGLYGGMWTMFNRSIWNETELFNVSVANKTNATIEQFLSNELLKNRTYPNVTNANYSNVLDVRNNATAQHIKSANVVVFLDTIVENTSVIIPKPLIGFNVGYQSNNTTSYSLHCYEPITLNYVNVSINSTYQGWIVKDIIWLW